MAGRPVFATKLDGSVDSDALAKFEQFSSFPLIFGDSLCYKGPGGEILTGSTEELIAGKVVCLVFDALWACSGQGLDDAFEDLAMCYAQYKAKGLNFEVVFVSHDNTAEDFAKIYGSMPWLALPFEDAERRKLVSLRYKAHGIPHKALVNVDSKIITLSMGALYGDPDGNDFPWTPKPFLELLGTKFQSKSGDVGLKALENKTLGLYFCTLGEDGSDAPRCPPQLLTAYQKLGSQFEVIVVDSSRRSRDEEVFNRRLSSLPFNLSIPFDDDRCDSLIKHFHLNKIGNCMPPLSDNALVMVAGTSGELINVNALPLLKKADEENAGVGFPWHAEPIGDISFDDEVESTCLGWSWDASRASSLIVFADRVDVAARTRVRAALEPIAREYLPKTDPNTGEQEMLFWMVNGIDDPNVDEFRKMLAIADKGVVLLMRVMVPSGFFWTAKAPEEVTEEVIRDFILTHKSCTKVPLPDDSDDDNDD